MKLLALLSFILITPAWGYQAVSGYEYLNESTRSMQDDEFENAGMVTVDHGRELFDELRPDEQASCSSCHGEGGEKLEPKRIARYPIYDEHLGGLATLQDQIAYCWEHNLDRFPLEYDDPVMIALETFVRHQAKGERIHVQTDGPMKPLIEQGHALYTTRYGQLDMSCQHCHVQHQGQMLRGQRLSQGQANGFPEYRLGRGRITSLHQRFSECFISFRADPFDPGSDEYRLLELYLMQRGNGLPVETPAVRF